MGLIVMRHSEVGFKNTKNTKKINNIKEIFYRNRRSLVLILFFLSLLFLVQKGYAHVKWFTGEEPVKAALDDILSPFFLILAASIALILGLIPQLSPLVLKYNLIRSLEVRLASLHRYTPHILRAGVVMALLIQMLFGSILAPELPLTDTTMWLGIGIASLLLISHPLSVKLGALGLIYLYWHGIQELGWFHMLDYGFYLAISFALFIQYNKYYELGIPALYLGTGLSLCWVAVEKWVFPGMSIHIIENHQIPTFGFEPSIFIILSAFIEFIVGYLLIVGILNRSLALLLTLIFVMTTTVFGWVEVAGHFMVHVILLIFIIQGTGFYKPPIEMHRRRIDQIIFVVLNFLLTLATILLLYYRFA